MKPLQNQNQRLLRQVILNVFIFISSMSMFGSVVYAGSESVAPSCAAQKQITSIFNQAMPDPAINRENMGKMRLEDLKKNWYQAPVTQKTGEMFNPVFLPFRYEYKGGEEDIEQPITFPCLLSFKFDFVPDNYCARHPAFIYRKEKKWGINPKEPNHVANYLTYWEATHAIYGTVIQQEAGYTGDMVVFDETGKEILKQSYDEPVPYFTLMGKMVKTWMDYRKQEVSEGLYAELIRPMTKDMECVRLYGKSFYVPWRTDQEWAIYEQILQLDPGFGEVRFWYANQKSWATEDFAGLQIEKGKALLDHLVMPALTEFDFKNCRDEEVKANFYSKLNYAEAICGENCNVMAIKLKSGGDKMSVDELDALIKVVEKYPSSWPLISNLAWEYQRRNMYQKSMPLYLSAILSGYLKGTGKFDWELRQLTKDFYYLGYFKESILCGLSALRNCSDENKSDIYWHLGLAYKELNAYSSAAKFFDYREKQEEDRWGETFSCLSLYQGGDPARLKELQPEAEKDLLYRLSAARECLAKGQFDEAMSQLSPALRVIKSQNGTFQLEEEIIRSDTYLLSGNIEKAGIHARRLWYIAPRSRQAAFLLEQTLKDHPKIRGRYAKVGAFIFKDDAGWCLLFDRLGADFHPEPIAEIRESYQNINKQLDTLSKNGENEFWQQFMPFDIEYLCMILLREDKAIPKKDILSFYERYSSKIKMISKWQDVHTQTFLILLQDLARNQK